jgi:hypothetical protein
MLQRQAKPNTPTIPESIQFGNKKRRRNADYTHNKKDRPGFYANMVSHLDHSRMKNSNDQKCCHSYIAALKIHAFFFCKNRGLPFFQISPFLKNTTL